MGGEANKRKKNYAHVTVLMDTVANVCETGEVEIELEAHCLPKTSQGLHLQANKNLSVNTGPGLTDKNYRYCFPGESVSSVH